ncbi:MAG: hypothetical protein E7359_02845 [Clostridiales bacterium]|nr:hypothetical protein [Clostridiales bacterium]
MVDKSDDFKRKLIMTVLYSFNIVFSILVILSFIINSKVLLFISSGFLLLLSIFNFVRILTLFELIFLAFYSILLVFLIFHFYNFAFATNVIKYSMYLVLLIAGLIAGMNGGENKLMNNNDPVIFAVIVMMLPIIYTILKIVNLYKRKN